MSKQTFKGRGELFVFNPNVGEFIPLNVGVNQATITTHDNENSDTSETVGESIGVECPIRIGLYCKLSPVNVVAVNYGNGKRGRFGIKKGRLTKVNRWYKITKHISESSKRAIRKERKY